MHKITLHDGTIIDNLELNGNNYISDALIADAVFAENLATVKISDGKKVQIFEDMKLIANQTHDGKSWIILAEKTAQDKAQEKLTMLEEDLLVKIAKLTRELDSTQELLVSKNTITREEKVSIQESSEEQEITTEKL